MIALRSRSHTGRRQLSTQQSTLGVSWMRKQFRAVAVHRGQVTGTWEPPEPIEGTDHFPDLLRQAIQATGYRGSTVSLVFAHQHLVHLLIEVPSVKPNLLVKVVNRQAQQQRLFPGEAVWSIESAETPKKGPQQFLLNLFPKMLLDDLASGCAKAGCFLTAAMPPPAVLRNQLFDLPAPDTQVVMIAAMTGETTTVLVGRSNGRVLLARVLNGNWQDSLPRMLVDLKRTILFVNQHDGVNVESLWLFGPGAAEKGAEIQSQLGLPTQVSPTPYSDDYWVIESLKLDEAHSQNLISREQRKAPQRRILAKVVGAMTVLVVATAAFLSWRLHGMFREERRNVMRLEQDAARLETRHKELQALHAEVALRQQVVHLVAEDRPAPVPAWVMGYLGETLPPELAATSLNVRRDGPLWRLHLAGCPQPAGTALKAAVSPDPLRSYTDFTNRLASGPFHVHFARPEVTQTNVPPGTNAAPASPRKTVSVTPASFLARIPSPRPAIATNTISEFSVEGWVQP